MAGFGPRRSQTSTCRSSQRHERHPKVVFSRTLEKAEWNNTRPMKRELITEVHELKEENGPGMWILRRFSPGGWNEIVVDGRGNVYVNGPGIALIASIPKARSGMPMFPTSTSRACARAASCSIQSSSTADAWPACSVVRSARRSSLSPPSGLASREWRRRSRRKQDSCWRSKFLFWAHGGHRVRFEVECAGTSVTS